MTVRMNHPTLPPEQVITVLDAAVPGHERSGWRVVQDDEDTSAATAEITPPAERPSDTHTDKPAATAARRPTSPTASKE